MLLRCRFLAGRRGELPPVDVGVAFDVQQVVIAEDGVTDAADESHAGFTWDAGIGLEAGMAVRADGFKGGAAGSRHRGEIVLPQVQDSSAKTLLRVAGEVV